MDVCTVYCIKYTPRTSAAYERTKAHVASKLNGKIEWEKREPKERSNGMKKRRTSGRGNEINFNLLEMAVCVLSYEHYTWFDLKFKCVTFCRHTVWIWYNFSKHTQMVQHGRFNASVLPFTHFLSLVSWNYGYIISHCLKLPLCFLLPKRNCVMKNARYASTSERARKKTTIERNDSANIPLEYCHGNCFSFWIFHAMIRA